MYNIMMGAQHMTIHDPCTQLCAVLANDVDTIRKRYWEYTAARLKQNATDL